MGQCGSPTDLDKLPDIGGDQKLRGAGQRDKTENSDLPQGGPCIVFFQRTVKVLVPADHLEGKLDFDEIQGQYNKTVKDTDFASRSLDAEGGQGGNAF